MFKSGKNHMKSSTCPNCVMPGYIFSTCPSIPEPVLDFSFKLNTCPEILGRGGMLLGPCHTFVCPTLEDLKTCPGGCNGESEADSAIWVGQNIY